MDFKNQVLLRLDIDSPKVEGLVHVLQGTQETFIAIGRYLEGASTTGRLPETVREKCTLSIKSLKMSSPPEVIVSVPVSYQLSLGEEEVEPDTGELAVGLFVNLSKALSKSPNGVDVNKLIEQPAHRVNILKNYTKIILDQCPIQIGTPEIGPKYLLDTESKDLAINIAKQGEEQVVRTEGVERIIGPVIEARIAEIVYFMIGNKRYVFDEEQEETIREMLGRVVSMDASVRKITKSGFFVSKIINLDVVNEWTFYSIKSGDDEIELSKPISATVYYHDEAVWLTDKDDLGVVGAGKTWNNAFQDFMFSFRSRILGYAGEPDEKLTDEAIILRDKLRVLVPKWREVLSNGGRK